MLANWIVHHLQEENGAVLLLCLIYSSHKASRTKPKTGSRYRALDAGHPEHHRA
jgi:hypothetical protein